ncbi:hypothetical protein ABMC89_11175 [Sulfitobacter sp. HNIBRBA3233]|uniref:hypothetical protein n=1 Tax=Sulfitobacter marinivivus TaxID=3158558 RepID=UPI0032DF46A3
MSYRSIALSAVAGLVLASAAQAQSNRENDVLIDQIGTDNSAIINQTGQRNLAGSIVQPMVQDGIFNSLDITQTGLDNQIGRIGRGLFQFGRRNTSVIFNEITIIQDSDLNILGSVVQRSRGAVTNGANTLSITQQGGNRNRINAVRQIQEAGEQGQRATVVMTGRRNLIAWVEQLSNDTGIDDSNEIDVTIVGSNNGRLSLSGFAAEPSLLDSSIVQEGDTVDTQVHGNKINLLIVGDDNRFGLRQGGRKNSMGLLTINGDENQIGLRQDGTENNIQMSVIEGDGNEVGIDQIVTNTASVNLIGFSNDNRIYAFQQGTNEVTATVEGNRNTLRNVQDYLSGQGGNNLATMDVFGNLNFADLEQLGGGIGAFGDNIFSLEIIGDRNNAGGPLLGAASRGGLTPGFFRQSGSGNEMAFTVAGSDNLFAAAQTGDANALTAVISGEANQAAVVQIGSYNVASLIQSGSGNNAGIYQ